jgi:hypothetical protein
MFHSFDIAVLNYAQTHYDNTDQYYEDLLLFVDVPQLSEYVRDILCRIIADRIVAQTTPDDYKPYVYTTGLRFIKEFHRQHGK